MKGWEWKFVVPKAVAAAFLDAVELHTVPQIHDRMRPVSYTRTTYLDTDSLDYLRSWEDGHQRRIRIREYASATHVGGAPVLAGDPWLELKESGGHRRTKVRFRASAAFVAELVARHGQVHADWEPSAALKVLRRVLAEDRPRPRMTTWYRRVSRVSGDERVRVTVDAGLLFARPEPIGGRGAPAKPTQVIERFGARIVEVKYAGDPPLWLVEAMALLPRARDFSKFREGMLALARTERTGEPARGEAT